MNTIIYTLSLCSRSSVVISLEPRPTDNHGSTVSLFQTSVLSLIMIMVPNTKSVKSGVLILKEDLSEQLNLSKH
jgi:hypothetical protein